MVIIQTIDVLPSCQLQTISVFLHGCTGSVWLVIGTFHASYELIIWISLLLS